MEPAAATTNNSIARPAESSSQPLAHAMMPVQLALMEMYHARNQGSGDAGHSEEAGRMALLKALRESGAATKRQQAEMLYQLNAGLLKVTTGQSVSVPVTPRSARAAATSSSSSGVPAALDSAGSCGGSAGQRKAELPAAVPFGSPERAAILARYRRKRKLRNYNRPVDENRKSIACRRPRDNNGHFIGGGVGKRRPAASRPAATRRNRRAAVVRLPENFSSAFGTEASSLPDDLSSGSNGAGLPDEVRPLPLNLDLISELGVGVGGEVSAGSSFNVPITPATDVALEWDLISNGDFEQLVTSCSVDDAGTAA